MGPDHLPCIQVEVVYVADASDWLAEAKDFVAKVPSLKGNTASGFENLGLQSFGLSGDNM